MARTTTAAVKDILLKDYDTFNEPSLAGFIESASAVVTRVAECATRKGITLSSEELELIERWLTAHFYVQSDATYSSRSTLRASGSFLASQDKYLQVAYTIDNSGCLQNIIENKSPRMIWLGKRPSNQTDYVDRD